MLRILFSIRFIFLLSEIYFFNFIHYNTSLSICFANFSNKSTIQEKFQIIEAVFLVSDTVLQLEVLLHYNNLPEFFL